MQNDLRDDSKNDLRDTPRDKATRRRGEGPHERHKPHKPPKSHEPDKPHKPPKSHEPDKSHKPPKSHEPHKPHKPPKSHELQKRQTGGNRRHRWIWLLVIAVVSFPAAELLAHQEPVVARRTLAVFFFACLAWMTEVVEVWITGGLVVAALAVFLPPLSPGISAASVLGAFASPVLVLFAGGFVLAAGLQRHGLDRVLAAAILRRTKGRPAAVLAGIMAVTAFLSMWMSNTAATALMLAVVLPIAGSDGKSKRFSTALLLGLPFAANLGGMATPVGTPPNAIAMGVLERSGHGLSFLQWMSVGLPAALVLSVLTWVLLWILHRPAGQLRLTLDIHEQKMTPAGWTVAATGLVTAGLWMTTKLHHIPSSVCALLPPAVFFSTGLLDRRDLHRLGWDVLILMAGGIALGSAMQKSGLSAWMLSDMGLARLGPFGLVAVFAILALVLSTFMSNTSTANLLVPLAMAAGTAVPAGPASVALMASAAMALPVSTPPNAIAHGSRLLKTRDMAIAGVWVGLAALAVNLVLVRWILW